MVVQYDQKEGKIEDEAWGQFVMAFSFNPLSLKHQLLLLLLSFLCLYILENGAFLIKNMVY